MPLNLATAAWPFERVEFYEAAHGYIVWRLGTGGNVELLHIKAEPRGRGHGRRLFYQMLERLRESPPYHSIYGFTRVSNEEARAFYGALGFCLQEVAGVYADGRAVLFWAPYEVLVHNMRDYQNDQMLAKPRRVWGE